MHEHLLKEDVHAHLPPKLSHIAVHMCKSVKVVDGTQQSSWIRVKSKERA